jgi:LmbE family N-acetylglucosaminyl deacetylase
MAIGAHADDIEVCVGGTLLKYRDAGYEIDYVMSTNNFSGNWNRLRKSLRYPKC